MALKREAAVAALYERLQSTPALASKIVTFSRAYKLPTQVPPDQQPALMLVTTEYEVFKPHGALVGSARMKEPGSATIHLIHCHVIIYATQAAEDQNPEGNLLNPIIDGIEEAISFLPGEDWSDGRGIQDSNLGGLVESVSFGPDPIMIVTGTASLQATVVIPIEILLGQGRQS